MVEIKSIKSEGYFLKGFLVLSIPFLGSFEVHALEGSYTLAEKVEVLESPVSVEWRGVSLYDYLQGIEKISDNGEEINFYAPVGEFASALDITVTESDSTSIAGWIGEPENSWYISQDYLSNKGKKSYLEKGKVISWNGELFASVPVLKEALGFSMELNESERIITIDASADIPMLLAMKRTESRKLLAWNEANKKLEEVKNKLTPFHVDPWAFISIPTLSLSNSFSLNSSKNSSNMGYHVSISNQMLWMDSHISLGGRLMNNANLNPDISLNSFILNRDFTIDDDILHLSLGDVSFRGPASPASTIGSGRGISIYERYAKELSPIESPSNVLYEGEGNPGDDVEVYRGKNDLIYSTVIPDSRVYQIPKQTLFAGMNTFYIREYDQGGLVKEHIIKKSMSQSQLAAGKSSYGIALLQPTQRMRDFIKKDSEKTGKDKRAGLSFTYALGVTENFTNSFGYSYIPTRGKDGEKSYISVFGDTATFSVGSASVSLNADTYLSGATNALTAGGSFSMPIGDDVSLSLGHTNYINNDAEKMFKKRSVSDASISISTPDLSLLGSISGRASLDRDINDNYKINLSTFGSGQLGPVNVSSSFSANLPQGDMEKATYHGSMSSSISPKGLMLSGQLGYKKDKKKAWKVNSYNLRAYLPGIKEKWGMTTRLSYDPDPDIMGISLGFGRSFDAMRLSTSLQFKSNKTYSIGLTLGTSLSYIPDRGFVLSGGEAPNRIIIPEYFVDSNDNGIKDKGENSLKGINTLISGTSFQSDKASDEDGRGFLIRNMKTNQPFTVTVDRGSLRDPFLTSKEKGYSVNSPAPSGEKLVIPIPMIRVSDVEVFIYERQGIKNNPISRMIFELYHKGEKVKRMRSMSGGELYFENLSPGEYTLKGADKQFGSASGYVTEDIDFIVSGEEIQIKKVRVQVRKKSDK